MITQNIDGLDLKAGMGDALIEIHGNRSRLRCIGCAKRTDLNDFVPLFAPDPCDECGEPVKFDAVMFGEPIVPEVMSAAREQIDRADCVVAIGTSATVRPASGLLWVAKHRSRGRSVEGCDASLPDAKLIEINPNPTKLSSICDVVVRMNAKTGVPALLEALMQIRVVVPSGELAQMRIPLADEHHSIAHREHDVYDSIIGSERCHLAF